MIENVDKIRTNTVHLARGKMEKPNWINVEKNRMQLSSNNVQLTNKKRMNKQEQQQQKKQQCMQHMNNSAELGILFRIMLTKLLYDHLHGTKVRFLMMQHAHFVSTQTNLFKKKNEILQRKMNLLSLSTCVLFHNNCY